MKTRVLAASLALIAGAALPASARSLEAIRSRGVLGLCAHPNSLPFASKKGDPPGFQIELGREIARRLGVTLEPDWVVTIYQIRSAECDIVLDTIADREAQRETHLRISKPYYHSGVVLVVPQDSELTSFASLDGRTKVGVQMGSMAAMVLDQRHVPISVFGFEDDSMDAVANHEIAAAAVSPLAAGYYNLIHPNATLRILGFDETEPALTWNVAVGMVRPDDALQREIDAAVEKLRSDGTIDQIYRRYGVALERPK
ncbi:MAG: transporter substrate-binding domain-containing protein [Acetobacteraceae bacterium]|nr:transporter substrate-binding domain-containing protein [Acetobacteraceae bacterium]